MRSIINTSSSSLLNAMLKSTAAICRRLPFAPCYQFSSSKQLTSSHLFEPTRLVKQLQQKKHSLVPPALQEIDQFEKDCIKILVTNFFADLQNIKISRADSSCSQKTPKNSLASMVIPISSDHLVQNSMFRFDNQVRVGKLMEFLDIFCGYISYKHIQQTNQLEFQKTLLTACVDHVEFFSELKPTMDINLVGYVTYVGFSSIEVQIDIYQEEDLVGTSVFLMVARSKDGSQAEQVPQLELNEPSGAESNKYRYQQGIRNQQMRKTKRQISLTSTEPTAEESKLLHSFFVRPLDYVDHIPINQTQTKDSALSQYDERNLHNKIFGGYLMRRMIEQGWLCGFLHLKGVTNPKIVYLSDIQFHAAVDIGSVLTFTSHVCYTQENYMDIKITSEIVNPSDPKQNKITTEMHLILQSDNNITPVFPLHYDHGILYLEGKRVLQGYLSEVPVSKQGTQQNNNTSNSISPNHNNLNNNTNQK